MCLSPLHHHPLLAGSLQTQLMSGEVSILAHQLAPCHWLNLSWVPYLTRRALALDDQPLAAYLGHLLTKLAQVPRQGQDQKTALWQLAWTNRVPLLGWGLADN